MSVHVDELTSDVVPEGGAAAPADPGAAPPSSPDAAADAYRDLHDRLARDAERTRAEAYGD